MSVLNSIKNAKPGDVVKDIGESQSVSGLYLRVARNGSRTFYLYYYTKSKIERRPKLGHFGDLTLQDARDLARDIKYRVAQGEDPHLDVMNIRKEPTVDELFEIVLKGYWDTERFRKSKRYDGVKYLYNFYLKKVFGKMKISQVTVKHVKAWLQSKSHIPFNSNRAIEVMCRMYNYAIENEIFNGRNPCSHVKHHVEKKRSRYATPDEIKKLCEILEKEKYTNPSRAIYIYLVLLTGARPYSILHATWDQLTTFNKDGKRYGILNFNGKSTYTTGLKEKVVIPPYGMELIDLLPRVPGKNILLIRRSPQEFWRKITKSIGAKDLRIRDLRRTYATVGLSSGVSIDTIGELLNHQTTQTTKIYAKLVDNIRVDSATLIVDKIIDIVKSKEIS